MCVIIGGLRKNLRRDEQLEGMRVNPSGFAIAVLREKKIIAYKRSLDKNDIMKIWDEAKDDDYIVTHSRIPSMGGMNANLDDCHLWEREGCLLAHNGTMVNMREIMSKDDKRTDSLVFFEDVFIPVWKSQGRNINPLVENIVKTDTHGSRICIITPDGEVHYYGDWVKDHDCMMSNRSYKVTSYSGHSGYHYLSSDYDSDYGYGYGFRSETATVTTKTEPAAKTEVKPTVDLDREYTGNVIKHAVKADLIKFLITHYIVDNICQMASRDGLKDPEDEDTADDNYLKICELTSCCGSVAVEEFMEDLPQTLTEPLLTDKEIDSMLTDFAQVCEIEFSIEGESTVKQMTEAFYEALDTDETAGRMFNTYFDWDAKRFKDLVTSWSMQVNRKHRPSMVNRSLNQIVYVPDHGNMDQKTKDISDIVVENLTKLYDRFRKGDV